MVATLRRPSIRLTTSVALKVNAGDSVSRRDSLDTGVKLPPMKRARSTTVKSAPRTFTTPRNQSCVSGTCMIEVDGIGTISPASASSTR